MSLIKKFSYSFLANIIFLIHLFLVLVVTFGWLTKSLFWLFVVALIATAISELILGSCILSIWEFGLRKKIDPTKKYDISCIIHYGRALFGLKPRILDNTPKSFFKKYSFLFALIALFIIGNSFHFLVGGF